MDPHLIRTFSAVARLGSFSAAAGELGYTQSAVSQQIAALESDLGVCLLQRRPVALTEAGTRLLEHAGPLLLRLAAARADVLRAAGSPAEHLTIGASPLAAPLLARALAAATRGLPRLDVSVTIAATAAVTAGVAEGRLDLGLVVGVTAPSDPLRLPDVGPLRAVGVAARPVVVALPADHPLAPAELDLDQLADARWIDAPDVTVALADLRSAAGLDGFRGPVRYEGTDVAGLIALVREGAGLAVLPAGMLPAGPRPALIGGHPLAGAPGDARPEAVDVVGVVGVQLVAPRLEYRTELLSTGRTSAAAHLGDLLTELTEPATDPSPDRDAPGHA